MFDVTELVIDVVLCGSAFCCYDRVPRKISLEQRVILAQGLKDIMLLGLVVFGFVTKQHIMIGYVWLRKLFLSW